MELFTIWTKGLIISSICLLFQIIGVVACHKNWNNCPLQSDALRFLMRVSIKECLNQCNIRNHCELICYRTATKLCELHGSTAKITPCKRCVSVLKEEQPVTPIICDDCYDGKTCNTSTGVCEYTECGVLHFPFGKTYGNLAYVGSKKVHQCFNHTDRAGESTCTSTGEWANVASRESICPSDEGILTLTDDLRVKICNKGVNQQDAKCYCNAIGGTLIRLDNPYKMEALQQIINTTAELKQHDYWVDGYSEQADDPDSWKFSDGIQMPMAEPFWAGHAPDGGNKPSCVRMNKNVDHLLDDKPCTKLMHYACQMP